MEQTFEIKIDEQGRVIVPYFPVREDADEWASRAEDTARAVLILGQDRHAAEKAASIDSTIRQARRLGVKIECLIDEAKWIESDLTLARIDAGAARQNLAKTRQAREQAKTAIAQIQEAREWAALVARKGTAQERAQARRDLVLATAKAEGLVRQAGSAKLEAAEVKAEQAELLVAETEARLGDTRAHYAKALKARYKATAKAIKLQKERVRLEERTRSLSADLKTAASFARSIGKRRPTVAQSNRQYERRMDAEIRAVDIEALLRFIGEAA